MAVPACDRSSRNCRRPALPWRAARVVFWNAERLKYPAAVGSAARSRQCRCPAAVRGRCRHGPLGQPAHGRGPRRAIGAQATCSAPSSWSWGWAMRASGPGTRASITSAGLHGAGHPVAAPRSSGPPWFGSRLRAAGSTGGFGERRVGGRIALLAEIPIAGARCCSSRAHYESHSDPADRLELDAHVARRHRRRVAGKTRPHRAAISTPTRSPWPTRTGLPCVAAALAADPDRLVAPMRHEPMFDLLQRRGYDWAELQRGARTDAADAAGRHAGAAFRQDRLAVRPRPALHRSGASSRPWTAEGTAISDHEALAVTVAPA